MLYNRNHVLYIPYILYYIVILYSTLYIIYTYTNFTIASVIIYAYLFLRIFPKIKNQPIHCTKLNT